MLLKLKGDKVKTIHTLQSIEASMENLKGDFINAYELLTHATRLIFNQNREIAKLKHELKQKDYEIEFIKGSK